MIEFEHFLQIGFMVILLFGSAFFSGSETAFFHLSQRTVRQFARSDKKIERLTALTLANPGRFLTALLFGNMLVNVLYFALTSMMSFQLGRNAGTAAGTLMGTIGFILLLLLGEMLPKSLAYSNARQFCMFATPPCYLLMKVLNPLLLVIDTVIVQPAIRLCVRPQKSTGVSVKHLKNLLDSSFHKGLISNSENQLMSEILKLGFLKVRHVMQPRVEMPNCSIRTTVQDAKQQMLDSNLVKIPVYTKSVDSIVGFVHLRDLFLHPERPLSTMVQKAHFVPEQKSVESLMDFFRRVRTNTAIVVDEYGGVAGWVELDDIMEQLLGPLEETDDVEPIEAIGPLEYRLQADLSIHEWTEAFGIDIKEERLATIGGFVIALLGRIPKEGDEVVYQNIKFIVERVKKNRIRTIILSLGDLGESNGELPEK